MIMDAPKSSPVVAGAGGLRKLRFAPKGWSRGKSGVVRVCYAYFEEHWTVLLVMAYGKGRKESLAVDEKQGIKRYLAQIQKWLDDKNR